MQKPNKVRRVKFDVDENDKITGVKAMSLVDKPAMGSAFIAFEAIPMRSTKSKAEAQARIDRLKRWNQ
jgi:hypothetical protein